LSTIRSKALLVISVNWYFLDEMSALELTPFGRGHSRRMRL